MARPGSTRRRDRTWLALILRGRRIGFTSTRSARSSTCMTPRAARSPSWVPPVPDRDRRADLEARRRDLDDALAELDSLEARCRDDLDKIDATASVG